MHPLVTPKIHIKSTLSSKIFMIAKNKKVTFYKAADFRVAPANIYLFKVSLETIEKGKKYVQS